MKLFSRTTAALAVIAVAALLGWTFRSSTPSASKPLRQNGKRKTAPDFALKDADGKTVHLSDYRGKVVVVDFWATWCPPCKVEIPWFIEFERKNKDRGFAVLGLATDEEGWAAVKPFVKEASMNYRIVLADDKTEDQYGGIEALPTTFLIDRDGRIAAVHIGLAGKKDFENGIEELLGAKAAALRGVALLFTPAALLGGWPAVDGSSSSAAHD